jgi:hypothetical protein
LVGGKGMVRVVGTGGSCSGCVGAGVRLSRKGGLAPPAPLSTGVGDFQCI